MKEKQLFQKKTCLQMTAHYFTKMRCFILIMFMLYPWSYFLHFRSTYSNVQKSISMFMASKNKCH